MGGVLVQHWLRGVFGVLLRAVPGYKVQLSRAGNPLGLNQAGIRRGERCSEARGTEEQVRRSLPRTPAATPTPPFQSPGIPGNWLRPLHRAAVPNAESGDQSNSL